jgi:hypothetical protein
VEIALLIIGILGLVPVGYLIYTTFIRKPHSVDFEIGNVALVRVASPNQNRDGKLALVIYSLAFVNTGPTSLTFKKVLLAYRFEGTKRQAELTDVPTGTVDGVKAIALANTKDKIMIAWTNLRETLSQNIPLQPGAVLNGSAVFLLDVPISRLRDISDYSLLVRDYSGGRSTHTLTPQARWYQAHEKNFSLMDAPVTKTGDQIHWQGITLTTHKPA